MLELKLEVSLCQGYMLVQAILFFVKFFQDLALKKYQTAIELKVCSFPRKITARCKSFL